MRLRPLLVLACTAAAMLMLAALSRVPYTPPDAEAALLRFSWRMSIVAREHCRPRTPAELEALPVHMRTPEICTPDRATYALITAVGLAAPDTLPLLRGGVKGDRPLFVLRERRFEPGRHRVRVELVRTSQDAAERLAALDTTLTLRAGTVELVTVDRAGRLVVVSGGGE